MKRAWAGVTAEKEISGIHHHFQEFKNSFMLNEIREMLIQYSIITQRKVNTTEGGSGCDSVGRVFASDTRCLRFKCSQQKTFIWNIFVLKRRK